MKVNRESGDQEKPIAGFEKLYVWQKAHALMLEIHKICKTLPRSERFRLRDQNHIRTMQGKNYIKIEVANDVIRRYEEIIRGINGYINWVREKRGDKK